MKIVYGSKTKLVSLPKRFASMAGSVQLFCGMKDTALDKVAAVAVNEHGWKGRWCQLVNYS